MNTALILLKTDFRLKVRLNRFIVLLFFFFLNKNTQVSSSVECACSWTLCEILIRITIGTLVMEPA